MLQDVWDTIFIIIGNICPGHICPSDIRSDHFVHIIVTLGSIIDFQLDWKSGKFQLARWSPKFLGHKFFLDVQFLKVRGFCHIFYFIKMLLDPIFLKHKNVWSQNNFDVKVRSKDFKTQTFLPHSALSWILS